MWNGCSRYKKIAISGIFNAVKIITLSVILILLFDTKVSLNNTQNKYNFNNCFTGNIVVFNGNFCFLTPNCRYFENNNNFNQTSKAFAVNDEIENNVENDSKIEKETEKKLSEKIDEIFYTGYERKTVT